MRALVILHPGFEEIEAITPMDLLSRAGIEVVSASINSKRSVTGRSSITLEADTVLNDVIEDLFDMVVLPGGPGIQAIRTTPLSVASYSVIMLPENGSHPFARRHFAAGCRIA